MPDILLAYGVESSRGTLSEVTTPIKQGKLSLAYGNMESTITDSFRSGFGSSVKDGRLYFDLSNNERIRINSYFSDYAHTATCIQTKNSNITKSYLLGIEYNHPDMESTPIYDTGVYLTATAGELAMGKLKITSTSKIKHIEFSRTSHNFITAPEEGFINFFIGSSLEAADSTLSISDIALLPGTTNKFNIGSSSLYWKDAYVHNIYNATSAFLNGSVYLKNGTILYGDETSSLTFYFPGTAGTLVTHPTKGTAVGGTNVPIYINKDGVATQANTYAGGTKITFNGASKSGLEATIYAPEEAGTSGQVLVSNGSGEPSWKNQNALTSVFENLSSSTTTNLTVKIGGTEKKITALYASALSNTTAIGGSSKPVYFNASGQPVEGSSYAGGTKVTLNGTSKGASTASFYAPTEAGASGQYLRSSGGAPSWSDVIKIQVLTADPSSPEVGQLWINTSA